MSLIFDKAVLDSHNCNVHARLCYEFITELPSFPSTEPGANNITFKRLLLKKLKTLLIVLRVGLWESSSFSSRFIVRKSFQIVS